MYYQKYNLETGSISSIRPFLKEDFSDSLMSKIDSTWSKVETDQITISLLADLELGFDLNEKQSDFAYRGGAGVGINWSVKNRLNVNKRNHKGRNECKTKNEKSSRWKERFVFGHLPQRSKAL